MELSKRKELILSAIVEQYIKTGEAVGSKALMMTLPISVSSATIRNEMSELSSGGYLIQPHTSAGRIPSQLGYRYYIDKLMSRSELSDDEKSSISTELARSAGDPGKLLDKAGELLAKMTNCAVVATTPTDEGALTTKIEIMQIASRLAMIVLMTSTGIIKNTVSKTDGEITDDMLNLFRETVAEEYVGKPVSSISTVSIQTLVASLGLNALTMSPLFISLCEIAQSAVEAEIKLAGQQNLLTNNEPGTDTFGLMTFLDQNEKLERAVTSKKDALSVRIGEENMFTPLENSSMIVGRYNIRGRDGGAIGIIGPTRLDYAKLIPSIEFLTKVISELLTDTFDI